MTYVVTLIPGDGIGPEVIRAATKVLAASGVALDWDIHDVGIPALEKGQVPLPEEVLASVRSNGVALKGPASTPAGSRGFPSVNIGLRRALDLYGQARRCRTRPGIASPFPGTDFVVIRETTEDLYVGIEFPAGSEGAAAVVRAAEDYGRGSIPPSAGLSIKFVTEAAVRRILHFAFSYTLRHGRKKLTVVHKATVMRCTDGMFLEVAKELAPSYPDVNLEVLQIDNLCGQLVRRPQDFDVFVSGIQYGDILSDLGAGLVGGIGTVPGANYGPGVAMFEPAHGTVPHRAGKDEADPMAAILCGALLLDYLGETDAAERVEGALNAVVAKGDSVTYDLRASDDDRPSVPTTVMTDAIISEMQRS